MNIPNIIQPFSPYWWYTMAWEAKHEMNKLQILEEDYRIGNQYFYEHFKDKRKRMEKIYYYITYRMSKNYNYIHSKKQG